MELVKEKWTKKDGIEFNKYLDSLKNSDKIEWTKRIINTNMNLLAIKSPVMKDIAKQIKKGNYFSFLDLMLWDYYEDTVVNGILISQISDFDLMKKYLDIYSSRVDNWSTCDLLSFKIKNQEDKFFNLLNEYIKNEKPFVRRIGINILFDFVNNDDYVSSILEILDKFEFETDYYVNMINAWLLCEMFIKHRDETLRYFESNKLNSFTINKAIQKCRDSYRVTKQDKDLLLKFKK